MNKDGSGIRIKPKSMKAWETLFHLTSLLGIKHKTRLNAHGSMLILFFHAG